MNLLGISDSPGFLYIIEKTNGQQLFYKIQYASDIKAIYNKVGTLALQSSKIVDIFYYNNLDQAKELSRNLLDKYKDHDRSYICKYMIIVASLVQIQRYVNKDDSYMDMDIY